jgi:DNA polymerase III delta prime subunit
MGDMLSHLKKETMHHAFVVEGDSHKTRPVLFDFLKKEFGMDAGHNDLILLDRGDFGIENVQEIIDVNSRKPTMGMYKVIVIKLHSISHQAQNAMLKTLEEPRPGTFIFVLTDTSAIFLPTILSRVQVVRDLKSDTTNQSTAGILGESINKSTNESTDESMGESTNKSVNDSAQLFIKKSSTERLAQIKEILALKSDEKIGDSEIFAFIQSVEKNVYDLSKEKGDTMTRTTVAHVFTKVEDYMRDTSSSKKLLLEYMALRLPMF